MVSNNIKCYILKGYNKRI